MTMTLQAEATWHHVRLVPSASVAPGQPYLVEFPDPVSTRALDLVLSPGSPYPDATGEALDILCVPGVPSDSLTASEDLLAWVQRGHLPGAPAPVTLTLHATQVVWASDRAAILATPERLDSLLLALVDFCHHERALRRLEKVIAESWSQLEADSPLAIEVTPRDLPKAEAVAQQAKRMLDVRRQQARLIPRLIRREVYMPTVAQQLGERLRERARVEERMETVATQLETFERVYEMTSSRFNEVRLARQEQTLEWIIILLLAAETLLLLIDFLRNLEK